MLPVSTLTANGTSNAFSCNAGWFLLTLTGDFGSGTATLQMSPLGENGTFATHVVAAPDGTPTNQTFTAAETKAYLGHGQTFRISLGSSTNPNLKIYVSGHGVSVHGG